MYKTYRIGLPQVLDHAFHPVIDFVLKHFFLEVMRVDNILPEHGELPHLLDLAVHLDQLTTWMGRGGYAETFSFQHFFPRALLHG